MVKAAKIYVRYVDATNRALGKVVIYLIFGIIGILLYEALSRTIFNRPRIWSVELAQFVMAAYYLLGGGYSLLIGSHPRMDILYRNWSAKKKAFVDAITFFLALLYLVVLNYGGIQSVLYALKYKQVTSSVWSPQMAPIKIIMTVGMFLMLLQLVAEFIKDLAIIKGENINYE